MPPRRPREDNDQDDDFVERLARRRAAPVTKPQKSDGRVAPLTRQRAVSLTVNYRRMEHFRTNDPEKAIEGTVLKGGELDQKNIYRNRRGDILFTASQGPSHSSASFLSNVPMIDVTSCLNRWDKRYGIRVLGWAENPSASRGDADWGDGAGTCAGAGSGTIINNGPFHLVCGDHLYALPIPEVVEVNGVGYSANAVRGTGRGGNDDRADWTQKLVPQILPLKSRNMEAMLAGVSQRATTRLERALPLASAGVGEKLSGYVSEKQHFDASIEHGAQSSVPGFTAWGQMEWVKQTLCRMLRQLHGNTAANRGNIEAVLKAADRDGNALLAAYWKKHWDEFKRHNDPDSITRLHRGTGHWLLPVGYEELRLTVMQPAAPLPAFEAPQAGVVECEMVRRVHDLIGKLSQSQRYIVLNDIKTFEEECYVGMVISPEAASRDSVNIARG